MTAAEPLLEARDLTVRFGPVHAVDDVSLAVRGGSARVAVIGESGSGKTTLLRTLLGLVRPSAGTVLFGGRPVARLDRAARARFRRSVQPVFQDGTEALDPRRSVEASIADGLRARGTGAARGGQGVAALLEAVGLDADLARRRPHELSGGQRQRVAIARALAVEPQLLLLDEPTSALDVTVQARIVSLLQDLAARRDLALVLVTHNLALVPHLCDDAYVMYAGRIVEHGPARALLRRPVHPYTRALRQAVPILGGAPPPVPPPAGLTPVPGTGCPYAHRCTYAHETCRTARPRPVAVGVQLVACHFAAQIAAQDLPADAG